MQYSLALSLKIRTFKFILKLLFLIVLNFGYSLYVNSTNLKAFRSGNWSSTETWGGSSVPTTSDTVTIIVDLRY